MAANKRIVIVDDDEDLTEALARRCSRAGYEVSTAYDGMNGLSLIETADPDLVILDVNMPSGNGLGVTEMIARDPCLRQIPIIIITGCKDDNTIRKCRNLRAAYLAKGPHLWSRLEPMLAEILAVSTTATATPAAGSGEETRTPPEPIPLESPQRASSSAAVPKTVTLSLPPEVAPTKLEEPIAAAVAPCEVGRALIDEFFDALGRFDEETAASKAPEKVRKQAPVVLCIDDDVEFANTVKLRLAQHGVQAMRAFNGQKGYLDAFTANNIQAILLDYSMPGGNGDYVLRKLKDNPVTSEIPVIVVSGRREATIQKAMQELGAAKFLTKPIDWRLLLAELGRHMPIASTSVGRAPVDAPAFVGSASAFER